MKHEISLDELYDQNIHTANRTLFFMPWNMAGDLSMWREPWEVDDWSAQNIIKGLYALDYIKTAPITIIWQSYGGDYDIGMGIYDTIKQLKSPVTMKCYGRVRSMGTIILQACHKRLLAPNCLFLIHYGTAGTDPVHQKDFQRFAEEVNRNNVTMEKIYLQRIHEKDPKMKIRALRELLKYDKYMSPKEAVDLGLADKVMV